MKSPRFSLPGRWSRVDLTDESTTRRTVRRMIEQSLGHRDELVKERAELRQLLQPAVDSAREVGASDFYVALELVEGIPLPAWLMVFLPSVEDTDFLRLGLDALTSALEESAQIVEPDARTSFVDRPGERESAISAVRQNWRRRTVSPDDPEVGFDVLEVDYWIAAAHPNRIALLTFSTGYAEYEEQMLALFDAVVRTIRWPADEPATEISKEPV
jgi:hypothetical protein